MHHKQANVTFMTLFRAITITRIFSTLFI